MIMTRGQWPHSFDGTLAKGKEGSLVLEMGSLILEISEQYNTEY